MKKYALSVLTLLFFMFTVNVSAQNRGVSLEIKDSGGKVVGRFNEAYALVIGESEYTNSAWKRLPGVKEDVAAIKGLFEELGFKVETLENANFRNLRNGIENFLSEYGQNESARIVIYYAGHGATIPSRNSTMGYIVPVDAPPIDSRNFDRSAIPMSMFESWAKQFNKPQHILFIFDSCFSGSVFDTNRNAPIPQSINNLIAQPVRQFITSGSAKEEVPDESIFRRELVAALRFGLADTMKLGYVTGSALGEYLYHKVYNYEPRKGMQTPQYGKLSNVNWNKGDFVFAVGAPSTPPPAPKPAPAPTPAAQSERPPTNMVRINGGTFMMGSPANEPERDSDETQHQVKVSSFFMGKYQVTQKEWIEVMGSNPSNFKGDNLPVECVSWYDVIEYCNKRSQKEGLTQAYTIDKSRSDANNKNDDDTVRWVVTWNRNATGYRLPTEAEWEYACRAGTTTPFNLGNNITTSNANYDGNYPYNNNSKGTYRKTTTPVGSFAANPWGLHDMHGNVWEWCWDWYGSYSSGEQSDPLGASSGSGRVWRGGCWSYSAAIVRSACRDYYTPSYRGSGVGFRLVRP